MDEDDEEAPMPDNRLLNGGSAEAESAPTTAAGSSS
jgi:hypothetical protein